MRRVLAWFGAIRPRREVDLDDRRHHATLARADRLLRVVREANEADEARRH